MHAWLQAWARQRGLGRARQRCLAIVELSFETGPGPSHKPEGGNTRALTTGTLTALSRTCGQVTGSPKRPWSSKMPTKDFPSFPRTFSEAFSAYVSGEALASHPARSLGKFRAGYKSIRHGNRLATHGAPFIPVASGKKVQREPCPPPTAEQHPGVPSRWKGSVQPTCWPQPFGLPVDHGLAPICLSIASLG